ncbi:acetolactate synthase, regulatory subunit [Dimargaris cristalligena]|uniref:Putative acetolactate synthase small subunit n=1 Tax=Dimargaris cristalligena TaxID=215637 RepID=A0A4P9ZXV1_9FUNG|nr:acetolactate synthase, regulatory subunit [Dimargaris cristalligena]RKP37742.1 putative acetolactate synthase small subunit precursor [Dimargaris cristalligena]|eukprot:RKP37742.1 putative acetolactate synthase small subunit precursor [Dimargaris cristalligena]
MCAAWAKQPIRHQSNDSSTKANSYKLSHPHAGKLSHPNRKRFAAPPQITAEEAVSNILYNTPISKSTSERKHILDCLAQDEPGVLSRVTGIMAARGYSIDTLVASKTEVPGLSRMTIVLKGDRVVMEQAKRQLEDLVPIWAVLDYTDTQLIQRELLLAKVSILGPEMAIRQMRAYRHSKEEMGHVPAYKGDDGNTDSGRSTSGMDQEEGGAPQALSSEPLMYSHRNLQALRELASLFQGRVVDVSAESMAIELSAKSERIDAFLALIRPFGILEAVRSGLMVMPRSQNLSMYQEEAAEEPVQANSVVDVSMLPPG